MAARAELRDGGAAAQADDKVIGSVAIGSRGEVDLKRGGPHILLSGMKKELGESTVVATGGLADLIAPYSEAIQYHEPWLTLHGLRLIFEKNQPG